MRPIIVAAAFGLFSLPAAAQSAEPVPVPADVSPGIVTQDAAVDAAGPGSSTATPTPRARMSSGKGSGCSYSTASPVS